MWGSCYSATELNDWGIYFWSVYSFLIHPSRYVPYVFHQTSSFRWHLNCDLDLWHEFVHFFDWFRSSWSWHLSRDIMFVESNRILLLHGSNPRDNVGEEVLSTARYWLPTLSLRLDILGLTPGQEGKEVYPFPVSWTDFLLFHCQVGKTEILAVYFMFCVMLLL